MAFIIRVVGKGKRKGRGDVGIKMSKKIAVLGFFGTAQQKPRVPATEKKR